MGRDSITRKKHTGEPGNGGHFGTLTRDEGSVSLGNGYETMTVADIDKELAGYHDEMYRLRLSRERLHDYVDSANAYLARRDKGEGRRWDDFQFRDVDTDLPKKLQEIEELDEKINHIQTTKIDPIDAEFDRRGGWTRFFLVASSGGGHVHKSMRCSTCFPTTRFIWLYDESGKTEEGIVERAGDGACTVCYPSAPVADRNRPRPNEFEDPEVKAAREQRAKEKIERDAARAAKALNGPDGNPVQGRYGPFNTERAAEIEAIDGIHSAGWYGDHPQRPGWNEVAINVMVAVAHKHDIPLEEVRASWVKKLEAKAKREKMDGTQRARALAELDIVYDTARTRR